MERNYINSTTVVEEDNIFNNYTDIELTNGFLTVFIIFQISVFIYIFLQKCFYLKK